MGLSFAREIRSLACRFCGLSAALAAALLCLAIVGGSPARAEEVADPLRELQREVEALRSELAALRAERAAEGEAPPAPREAPMAPTAPAAVAAGGRLDELERRVEILAAELERLTLGRAAAPEAEESAYGLGPAASKVYRTAQGLSIGGYGELLYEGFDSTRDDGSPSGRRDQLDLLRAIVYVGYKFNDRLLLNTEVEYEHASTGEGGEVSVEFAYLDYLLRPEANLRGGLLLVPMGLTNELHEPTVFPSARRPGIETAILPTTWRENGFGLFGGRGPWSWRAYLVNGFDALGFTAGGLRGGRQKGSRTAAEDLAWVGRLDWEGVPGLLVGASAYAGDSGQGLAGPGGESVDVATTILEGHVDWRWRGARVRLLGVRADLDDVAALNRSLGLTGTRSIGESMAGFYAEAAYDLFSRWPQGEQSLTPFVRYESYDTQEEVPPGFASDPFNDVESWTLGLAYQPIDRVILKLDYQDIDNRAGTGVDQVNLALGYVF